MNITINALVILYDTKPIESKTIQSIIRSNLGRNVNLNLIIWNNGPHYFDKQCIDEYTQYCKRQKIEIYQDTRNISLSKIYNNFLKKLNYDFLVIFDQDSNICDNYFRLIYKNKNIDVLFPVITFTPIDTRLSNHSKNLNYKTFNAAETKSIGSGLCISKKIVLKLLSEYGDIFDENFAFYFADFSFFNRLKRLGYVSGKKIGSMSHEISGIARYDEMNENTKCELGYGKILLRIFEKKKSNLISSLIYCIKYWLKSRCSVITFYKITMCMLMRKHPRSKFNITLKKTLIYKN
ncbi:MULTISPECIES: hypothetical protein [Pectobacterium]|uniref:hypothetical protein n=1 Tax=Pectobacterium TaxID=122277 RepID=UPI00058244D2|nr:MULTISPECIES: hypothetical protein [Pectobacterium]KHS95607.1 hypothetical protein RC88_10040 [Pectobacterium parvum]UVD97757.1 hypothetical protein NV347_01580 [Pectobacterium parvum]GKW41730.1 hypothetical protein PEC301879_15880 [Pectobacterium carotovorum subsp. carotovorum]